MKRYEKSILWMIGIGAVAYGVTNETTLYHVTREWAHPTQYRAEVGYREGSSERWWFGRDTDRETCTNEAVWKYNSINADSPSRAFSWACLRIRGGNILGRVR